MRYKHPTIKGWEVSGPDSKKSRAAFERAGWVPVSGEPAAVKAREKRAEQSVEGDEK